MTRRGLKPLLGCEFYIVDDATQQTRVQESLGANAFPHVTVLAMNGQGYENLLTLSRLSWEKPQRYYKPRIDFKMLHKYQEGLVVLSGCPCGYPTRLIAAGKEEEARQFLATQKSRIEHFYVELDPCPGLESSEKSLGKLVEMAYDLGIKSVLTADAHFPSPGDHLPEDILLCTGLGTTLDDPNRAIKLPENLYVCTRQELIERAKQTAPDIDERIWARAASYSEEIAQMCNVELPKGKKVVFHGLKPGNTAAEELWRCVSSGLIRETEKKNLPRDQFWTYYERARYEFEVLSGKDFCDYLLAIADVAREMQARHSVVVCRGSAGGCLLLWLLGASVTDPIRHGLSFERFYDVNRPDPPDVDMDFEQGRREEAFQYVRDAYKPENCSQLAAISQLKARSAVLDVAAAYGIPRAEVAPLTAVLHSNDENVDRQLDEVTDPRALAVLEKYPQLRVAQRLIGQYRQTSIHAAGVVISSMPIDKVCGVMTGKSGQAVAAVDKRGAATLELLKMDFLSVAGLDKVGATIRRLGRDMAWLTALPLDDKATLELANAGYLAGIFQLDGGSAARVSREIGLHSFEDIVAASALCRPGPGDWVSVYQENKRDPERFVGYLAALPPVIADIVRPTYGILLYQEQVMRLLREAAGMDWPDVHKLRKGIGDKQPEEWWNEYTGKFLIGCAQHGIAVSEAQDWWEKIKAHGGYSFNRSHCVTYGLVAYWMLYLKTHHPAEFYHSYVALESDAVTVKKLIREYRARGGEVRLLDPTHSRETFVSPEPGVLVGGYLQVHGIGPKMAEKLLDKAPYADWPTLYKAMRKDIRERVQATGVHAGLWDPQQTILTAPWFPVPRLGSEEQLWRQQAGLPKLGDLPHDRAVNGDVLLLGYVVATKFEKDRVAFVIEDETAAILCRVPSRQLAAIGDNFRGYQVADFVAVSGWWTSDTLYIKSGQVLKPRPAKATHKGLPVPDGKSELQTLEEIALNVS